MNIKVDEALDASNEMLDFHSFAEFIEWDLYSPIAFIPTIVTHVIMTKNLNEMLGPDVLDEIGDKISSVSMSELKDKANRIYIPINFKEPINGRVIIIPKPVFKRALLKANTLMGHRYRTYMVSKDTLISIYVMYQHRFAQRRKVKQLNVDEIASIWGCTKRIL